jgi:hypothetical protein
LPGRGLYSDSGHQMANSVFRKSKRHLKLYFRTALIHAFRGGGGCNAKKSSSAEGYNPKYLHCSICAV